MLKTIVNRWKAETPDFFKKVKRLAIAIGVPAFGVWQANSMFSLQLDEITLTICKYTIAACAAMGLTAQLTAKNPENLK